MIAPFTIRKCEPADLDAVHWLAEKYASWDTTPTKADIEGFQATGPELFFVAEVHGNIAGFVYGLETKHLPDETLVKWKAAKVASIEILAVDQSYRKRGIGTALVNEFLETCKAKAVDLVTLSVPAEEIAARTLYRKLGFKERAYFLKKHL